MEPFQKAFVALAIARKALSFGRFELKSGRISPYFFNAGIFYHGSDLAVLGRCYADAIVAAGVEFDVLFGPAYKGIPLAASTAVALAERHGLDKPYCFNRKEAKNHGEGGLLVGAPLEGRVLVVDDVITAGTAIREVVQLISHANASIVGVVVGLDRKETAISSNLSAVQQVEREFGFGVHSIVDIDHIIEYLESTGDHFELEAVREYRRCYGVSTQEG